MPVKLILDVFSGRPNPEILLDDKTARELFKKISFGALRKENEKTNPFPSVLGYRGIIIEQTGKLLSADFPKRLHYAHDTVYADGKAAKAEAGLEAFLFDNFKSLKGMKGASGFRREAEELIKRYLDKRRTYIENHRKWYDRAIDDFLRPVKVVCPCSPTADLAAWNTDPNVTGNNNCYNYGTNYRTDTYAQPGEASSQKWNDLSGCNVAAGHISAKMGAVADGLIDVPNKDNKCISPGHLVALVNYPNHDYHWYRKGSNGRWSHKMGGSPATILDDSGNPITDPRTADRGSYTGFCTFMQVIHGHFKIT
ncbi:MAG TPA: hypothetical protein PKA77_06300 [Chitinophagaceae bacterium]|jgi:hypothetical protein|nr:hypothetical protein [Chitinophagaceae bacterium]HMU57608.1 hypothetical protein [Chitinophagaceae bacterium]